MRYLSIIILLCLAAVSAVAGEVSEHDRFQLWNGCKPLAIFVSQINENATAIGLTKEQVEVAARSRLRAARIYASEVKPGQSSIYVNVDIGKSGTFLVSVELLKLLEDKINGIYGFWSATTWNTYGFGTHGYNSTTIVSLVSQLTDKLIDEYLRVNAGTCK